MNPTRQYTSNSQQTVFDVALMHYGSVSGLAYLLADNPDLVQSDGTIRQFTVAHKIQRYVAVDERIKARMLVLIPCTEGSGLDDGTWITEDGQNWITDDNQSWINRS